MQPLFPSASNVFTFLSRYVSKLSYDLNFCIVSFQIYKKMIIEYMRIVYTYILIENHQLTVSVTPSLRYLPVGGKWALGDELLKLKSIRFGFLMAMKRIKKSFLLDNESLLVFGSTFPQKIRQCASQRFASLFFWHVESKNKKNIVVI